MEKKEVLKKAQTEHKDEREMQILDHSYVWIYMTMLLTAAFFAFFRESRGVSSPDLTATICAAACAGHLYRYFKAKHISDLITGVVLLIIALVIAVKFLMEY